MRDMGPSRVAAFPVVAAVAPGAGNSQSSDQDSESSASLLPDRTHQLDAIRGMTLEELIASGKAEINPPPNLNSNNNNNNVATTNTTNPVGPRKRLGNRLSVMLKSMSMDNVLSSQRHQEEASSSEDSGTSVERISGSSGSIRSAPNMTQLLDVPVSGSRSLRTRTGRQIAKVSDVFSASDNNTQVLADGVSGGTSNGGEEQVASEILRDVLGGFNPREKNSAASLKRDFKMKRGSENLLNLVLLSQHHEVKLPQEEDVPPAQVASVELLVGNRCANSPQPDTVVWTVFVEQLHVNAPDSGAIESVTFGPLPPGSDTQTLVSAPFSFSRESSLTFLEAMDFQVRIVVSFVGGSNPAVFHHDLNVPGSWGHYEVDRFSGVTREISGHLSEPLPKVEEDDMAPRLELSIRQAMEHESVTMGEETVRLAHRIGKGLLVLPFKRSRNQPLVLNALRPRIRAFLVRGAVARGATNHEQVTCIGDENATVGDTVNLCCSFCQLAPDSIAGTQFVTSMAIVLCSTLNSSKSLLLAAKTITDFLDHWPRIMRNASSLNAFSASSDDFRSKMELTVRNPPPLFDEEELKVRLAAALKKQQEALERRKALVSTKQKGFYGGTKLDVSDDADSRLDDSANLTLSDSFDSSSVPSTPVIIAPPAGSSSPPDRVLYSELRFEGEALAAISDMPGNPLMKVADVSPSTSPGKEPPSEFFNAKNVEIVSAGPDDDVASFSQSDYGAVARARSEDQLMQSPIAIYFRDSCQSEMTLGVAVITEMFFLISDPFQSMTIRGMPDPRKPVQKVRAVLKLVHMSSVIVKAQIRNIGKVLFQQSSEVVCRCMSVLWRCLSPPTIAMEGDRQLRIMHETIRLTHFCDIMELFRMFYREKLLLFLSDAKLVVGSSSSVVVPPTALLIEKLENDGVFNLFVSLLGAELVQPRKVWFSDKGDVTSLLISKMKVALEDPDSVEVDRRAENASHILKKIVSSLEHVKLNELLLENHELLHRQAFGPLLTPPDAEFSVWHEKQFRFTVRVLSDWALMTLGRFRNVSEKLFSECLATTIRFLPIVKDVLQHSYPPNGKLVGFVRLEMVNYVAALINSRNSDLDDALNQHQMIETVCDLFFSTVNASLLHSHITEFILVPICEDGHNKILQCAIQKARLLDRIMQTFVNVADINSNEEEEEHRRHHVVPQINGFLTQIAVAVSKSGAADTYPGWDRFVRTRLLPTIKLQSRDELKSTASSPESGKTSPSSKGLVVD